MKKTQLKDIIAYIAKEYPNKSELSNARLTKMVYLADWHQAINYQKQITNINWLYNSFGPYVDDVIDEAKNNSDLLAVEETQNPFGNKKVILSLKDENYEPDLTPEQKASIKHIIEVTMHKNWDDFIRLVYSTYPVLSSQKYSNLDLLEKAKEYKKQSAD